MPSKMVTDRMKSSRAVEAAAEVHAEELAAALAPRLGSVLGPGESLPDLALLARLLGRLLAAGRRRMEAADEVHDAELADDRGPRRRRDDAAGRLREALTEVRQAVDGVFGKGRSTELLGLTGRLRDPVVLARLARSALARLEDAGVAWPPAQAPGVAVEPAHWAAVIVPALAALEAALADVARERREGETSLAAKLEAMADYDETFAAAAGLLEALFSAAGLAGLAARVRPSPRRAGRTQEEVEGPAEPGPEAETGDEGPTAGS